LLASRAKLAISRSLRAVLQLPLSMCMHMQLIFPETGVLVAWQCCPGKASVRSCARPR